MTNSTQVMVWSMSTKQWHCILCRQHWGQPLVAQRCILQAATYTHHMARMRCNVCLMGHTMRWQCMSHPAWCGAQLHRWRQLPQAPCTSTTRVLHMWAHYSSHGTQRFKCRRCNRSAGPLVEEHISPSMAQASPPAHHTKHIASLVPALPHLWWQQGGCHQTLWSAPHQ